MEQTLIHALNKINPIEREDDRKQVLDALKHLHDTIETETRDKNYDQ